MADHGFVRQEKPWGSTGRTRDYAGSSGDSGERPIGAANNTQQNTEASCHIPHSPATTGDAELFNETVAQIGYSLHKPKPKSSVNDML